MKKIVVGIMGPGNASPLEVQTARELGRCIASQGWILLTGGCNSGVMTAANQGAKEAGGLTLGILPDRDDRHLCPHVDIAIVTDMGSARNNINVLSSDVVVACGMGPGTASEIALALKAGKFVILLHLSRAGQEFFAQLAPEKAIAVDTPAAAVDRIREILANGNPK